MHRCKTANRLGLLILLFAAAAARTAAPPVRWPAGKLEQREGHSREASRLERAGKLKEAIAEAEKMLAIERQVLGSVHKEIAGSLDRLGRMHARLGDFAAAQCARQEALACCNRLYGPQHWIAVNARLALEDVRLFSRLTDAQRAELTQAAEQHQRAGKALREGKPRQGLEDARRSTQTRQTSAGSEAPRLCAQPDH